MTFPAEERMGGEAEMADAELAHEDRAADPAGAAYAPPPAEFRTPESAPGGTPVPGGTGVDAGSPVGPVADARWSKIQAMFVDDPRSSVAEAASLVDEAVEAFISTVREEQASLASSWQAENAGTEELRAAFRDYRTFWNSVTGLSQPA